NSIIRDNVIRKIGRTGIRLIETENIQISGNHLSDILGVHGNGISVYLKNRNILIADNILENVPFAFTYHGTGNVAEAHNMWLLNHVFMGRVRSWGSAFDKVYFLHNLAYAEVVPAKAIHIPGAEPRPPPTNNILANVPFAFTYRGTGNVEEANNMWLLSNVFMGRVRSWGSAFDKVYFLHNLAYAEVEPAKAIHTPGEEPRTTLKNNIIDGLIV